MKLNLNLSDVSFATDITKYVKIHVVLVVLSVLWFIATAVVARTRHSTAFIMLLSWAVSYIGLTWVLIDKSAGPLINRLSNKIISK